MIEPYFALLKEISGKRALHTSRWGLACAFVMVLPNVNLCNTYIYIYVYYDLIKPCKYLV